MNRAALFLAGLLCIAAAARADTVTIDLDAGLLENATGTAVVVKGGLLQFIASPSGTFPAPTSAAYATGDNLVLSSFAMNYNSGITGETVNARYSLPVNAGGATSGEKVILRFYPALTLADMPAVPTAGTTYGQVRSDTVEYGSTGYNGGFDYSETAWVLPSGGSTVDFDYITQSDGGRYADATADATDIVAASPEPTSLLLLTTAAAPLVFRRRRAR